MNAICAGEVESHEVITFSGRRCPLCASMSKLSRTRNQIAKHYNKVMMISDDGVGDCSKCVAVVDEVTSFAKEVLGWK